MARPDLELNSQLIGRMNSQRISFFFIHARRNIHFLVDHLPGGLLSAQEEERRKLEFGKKVALLRKQEAGGQDWTITARTRSSMEELQMEIVSLQESIARTCSSISKLRDEELHPQLVELCSG